MVLVALALFIVTMVEQVLAVEQEKLVAQVDLAVLVRRAAQVAQAEHHSKQIMLQVQSLFSITRMLSLVVQAVSEEQVVLVD